MNRISDLTRRLWAALLALCLVLALTLPVFAEGESGTADTAEKETFHIGTVDDLMQLADSCRLDSWSKNRTVYLDADLELTGSGFAGIPSFSGVFEGQGHTISGLSLVDDGSVIGFFRYVQQGANVRDLVIRGRSMPTGSRSTVGGIAGSNAGTLHNCRFEGVSSGASVVGGIAGTNLAAGVIESCTTTGSVYGAHFIGGIAGENHGIRSELVNQQLRGGGRIDQSHAAYRCGNLDDVRTEGVDRAGHDVKAALGGVRHMRERFGDQRHFLIQCANNSYSFHTHT